MKIQILGHTCSGKSQLARYLSKKLSFKYIETDRYLLIDNFDDRIESYINDIKYENCYIVDGYVDDWFTSGHYKCDFIIFLKVDEENRMIWLNDKEMRNQFYESINKEVSKKYDEKYFSLARDIEEYEKKQNFFNIKLSISKAKKLVVDGNLSLKQIYYIVIDFLDKNKKGKKNDKSKRKN
ncbi:hypothetical protein SHELI_v1c06100 [Spiroplasma helicoides]|uniref:Adenylate kinase n=1 Tax=Spiroplasma helicoides TaxID=216938 RepID=A0A1B3SKV2_9MOLU|nr:hypothetical protein [Spiroplasma helicoides]AOG60561.1 hypothetical protein SHELI_v1c06100 [Spiroplasma helicoides]